MRPAQPIDLRFDCSLHGFSAVADRLGESVHVVMRWLSGMDPVPARVVIGDRPCEDTLRCVVQRGGSG